MNQDDQPITRKDLKEFADIIITQVRGEMQTQGEQLQSEMQAQGKAIVTQLRKEMHTQGESIVTQLRDEMRTMEDRIVENLRDEFTSKLAATANGLESNLKRHTEDVVAGHSGEVLQAIANVVEPMQVTVNHHGRRITRLEHKLA
jgi:gas vesicle protein